MNKLPLGVRCVIFILLVGLQFGLFNLILFFRGSNLFFSKTEFEIIFLIVAIIGMLLGIFFVNIFRAWTPEELVERMENEITINTLILALQRKKSKLKSEIPDPIEIIVRGYDAQTGRMIKK